MARCEMCGAQQDSLTTAKIEGAELDVCDSCAELGTPLDNTSESKEESSTGGQNQSRNTTTQSTNRSSGGGAQSTPDTSTGSGQSGSGGYSPNEKELVFDYGDKIQKARQRNGMNRAELADEINEKESLVSRLENGRSLPSEEVRRKLEQALDISLLADGGEE